MQRLPLFLLLSLFTLSSSLSAFSLPKEPKDKAKQEVASSKANKGLFDVTHSGDDWYFHIPDTLLGRDILVTVRYTGTPAYTGKYGGEQVGEQTIYFQTIGKDRLLMRSRLIVNRADTLDAINAAVRSCSTDPIIASFKIENVQRGKMKVKVTDLFLSDNQALGLSSSARTLFGAQSFMRGLSYIESIHTFPTNTEVRTVNTWTSMSKSTIAGRATGKVTVGLNISFVLLPKEPMMPRLFDPRVGYFTNSYIEFADHQQSVTPRRFITRWRLEPKDSADAEKMKRGELIEPKKPIVYYIDPATPKQWRPYLIAGVNDWQKAFEKAGFKNAIMAKEWPENDSTMSMEDARFSVIRYLASHIENAYGPHVSDPRSGEIIESHICWYHNVMSLVHDWYMVQASTLDEAARCMKFDTELMGQLIRFVSSHEVGHTLGLRHNFGSSSLVPVDSLRSKTFLYKHGHTPSIMDYARFNYVAQPEDSIGREGLFPRIGDYDEWAIEWGYRIMPGAYDCDADHWELEPLTSARLRANRRLWFGDGETNRTNDPRCQTEDLGDDAMKASEYGIRNLQRELQHLPAWTYESNDINGDNLRTMYGQIANQFNRYCFHVLSNIGGTFNDYKAPDEEGSVYSYNSREDQQRAVDFLDRHILHEPTWLTTPAYMARITPQPRSYAERIGQRVVSSLLSSLVMLRLNPNYPLHDYLDDVTGRLFAEAKTGAVPSDYRKLLQADAVNHLIMQLNGETNSKTFPAIYQTLTNLRATFALHPHNNFYASLLFLIDRALKQETNQIR